MKRIFLLTCLALFVSKVSFSQVDVTNHTSDSLNFFFQDWGDESPRVNWETMLRDHLILVYPTDKALISISGINDYTFTIKGQKDTLVLSGFSCILDLDLNYYNEIHVTKNYNLDHHWHPSKQTVGEGDEDR